MKSITFLLASLVTFSATATELNITEIETYAGTLGKSKIYMTLAKSGSDITGQYEYEKFGKNIPLNGEIKKNKVTLLERNGNNTYYINATSNPAGSISGVWKGNNKSYEFNTNRTSYSSSEIISDLSLETPDDQTYTLSIKLKNGSAQKITGQFMSDNVEVIFEDMNFDKYPDIRILEIATSGNSSYSYFLYDTKNNIFIMAPEEFSELTSPKFLHKQKLIISINKDGCCKYTGRKISQDRSSTATYDYTTDDGQETIKLKESNNTSTKKISKKYFEDEYINK